jgi:hypothetical protein
MTLVRFEPTISTSERPQHHTLDRAAIGIGLHLLISLKSIEYFQCINMKGLYWNMSLPSRRYQLAPLNDHPQIFVGAVQKLNYNY